MRAPVILALLLPVFTADGQQRPARDQADPPLRIIRAEVLEQFRRTLINGGSGIYVTDHREYFEAAAPLIESAFRSERRIPGPDDPPRTNYEAKYRAEGREIYEVRFWK